MYRIETLKSFDTNTRHIISVNKSQQLTYLQNKKVRLREQIH